MVNAAQSVRAGAVSTLQISSGSIVYATQAILIARYGSAALVALSDRAEQPTGSIDPAVVERALADAAATIDGYLAGKYALPLTVASPLLEDLAAKIAFWNLHIASPDEKVKIDYEQALRQLREIAAGPILIPGATGLQPAGTGASGATFTDRERPFAPETMKGFI